MAIYFNDKMLLPKKDGNELEQKYYNELADVTTLFKEKKGAIVLVRDVERIWDSKRESYRPTVPYALPVEIPVYLETLGAVSVRYSKNPPQRQGKNITYPMNRIFVEERMYLTENTKDLAWFLLKATKFVKNGDPNSNAFMRIDDPQAELVSKASKVKRISKVDALLINDESPIYNMRSMMFLADKFGIDIKDYDVEASGFMLREAVISGEEKNHPDLNIEKFLAMADKLANFTSKDSYTMDELDMMSQKDLNMISKAKELPYPPRCSKDAQKAAIIEKNI